ncbi:copper chaperone PCu(A)C [Herbidospora sp. NEAU-GS84]|uniref:Copper chaperone PCu(A)C n=1 Tax=Herbidospora solisilvae TaxID=2696284 RepID=A0A7C9P2S5_9ACTN|nr:copper chaperone PCu(A)C [Herbidospora solisilvae]NAS26777.1 copper chaperone PCu(A)C [Herbidospora solisilvae]
MSSRLALSLLAVATAATVVSCGSSDTPTAAAPAASAPAASAPAETAPAAPAAAALSITDPWVKTAKEGMTAAFGTLVNNSGADITVVSGASPLSSMIELHEVVDKDGKMVMQPKQGGFVIPAGGSHELKPGGDHIMIMDAKQAVEPGAEIPFTLTLADGGTFEFTAVGKDFAGAKEDYQPGSHNG